MFKKIISLLFTVGLSIIVISEIPSITAEAAGNTTDTRWSYHGRNHTYYDSKAGWVTGAREKRDYTSHYVYNVASNSTILVSGLGDAGGNKVDASCSQGEFKVPRGTSCYIYNGVKEKGYSKARLKIRTQGGYSTAHLDIVWSPDSV